MFVLYYLIISLQLNYIISTYSNSYTYQTQIYDHYNHYYNQILHPILFNIIPLSANASRISITINNLGISMFQQKFIYDIARALYIDPSRVKINSIKPLGENAPGIVIFDLLPLISIVDVKSTSLTPAILASNFQIQFYNFRSSLLSVGDVTYSIATGSGVIINNFIRVYLCADLLVREDCAGIGYYSVQGQTAATNSSDQVNSSLLIGLLIPLLLLVIAAIIYWFYYRSKSSPTKIAPNIKIVENEPNLRPSSIMNQNGEHILITTKNISDHDTCCMEIQKPVITLVATNHLGAPSAVVPALNSNLRRVNSSQKILKTPAVDIPQFCLTPKYNLPFKPNIKK